VGGLGHEREGAAPAASVVLYGKGKIASVYANLGSSYLFERSSLAADFLAEVVRQLLPEPAVKTSGSNYLRVNLKRDGEKSWLHLIDSSGPHDNEKVFEWQEILPLPPIQAQLKTAQKPQSIRLQPEGKTLKFTYENGVAEFVVPPIEIYSIVQVE
jgi:hypothetical protein